MVWLHDISMGAGYLGFFLAGCGVGIILGVAGVYACILWSALRK